ncbi:MAG: hemerythrin domain-containing protein [Phycisphaerales bacterium]
MNESPFENEPIVRHTALQPFSRDHYVGLVQASHLIKAADQDSATRRKVLAEFVDAWSHEIEPHFAEEERLLIALMRDEDGEQLFREHAAIRQIADEAWAYRRQVEVDPDWMRQSGQLLRDHIRWEERHLFVTIERDADAAQLRALGHSTAEIEQSRQRNICRD